MPDALGMVETVGLAALVEAGDAMCKAAGVGLLGWDRVGSGLVTVFCRGDVAAVKSALDAGAQSASQIGRVHCVHVIPRPHEDLHVILPSSAREQAEAGSRAGKAPALGMVETRGATGMIEAADVMCKTASVEVAHIQEIGGGYVTAFVTGDVGSVMAAVGSGAEAAERAGELVSRHVIPRPIDDVFHVFLS
ncbi:MAG: BMC domain-containing protein [Candidatus Latescibacteria bacterium]|nr:BMC domain-containing protein [Candidatus Latescibacterota bacterium]